MQTVLITGGTGLIGRALTKRLLQSSYEVIVFTRNEKKKSSQANLHYAHWDIDKRLLDIDAFAKADIIVHLAGAGVADKPWTAAYKQKILQSRTQSAALLVKALRDFPNKVKTIVSGSAIGYYKPSGMEYASKENDEPANSFLAKTCVAWEDALKPAAALGKRLVFLRTGIVLSPDGGYLDELLKPMSFRIAPVLGSGNQVVSWIHIDDHCGIIVKAMQHPAMSGPYNAVAPNPVSSKQLSNAIAQAKFGKGFLPFKVPAWSLKMLLGERSIEVLKSANVSAKKIMETGYQFIYPNIEKAAENLVSTH